jgi:hypothetical protein
MSVDLGAADDLWAGACTTQLAARTSQTWVRRSRKSETSVAKAPGAGDPAGPPVDGPGEAEAELERAGE